jgi:hypothetical protein
MKKLQLVLFLFLLPTLIFSQEIINARGVIVDESGEPVIGATIIQENDPSNGTVSDVDGGFSINVPVNARVEISYIGYISQVVNPTGDRMRVVLVEDTQTLDELVVIGYGTLRKSDLTGAVTSIKAEDLNPGMSASLEQALQGRVAGVQISQKSNEPGED